MTIDALSDSDLDTLFLSPDVYVREMDWTTCEAICLRMSRDSYARSSFLDHRAVAATDGELRAPIPSLMDAYNDSRPASPAPMFIAHTALCGSTVLTRCLDFPERCLPFREPYLFHQLSGIWRLGLQGKVHGKIGRDSPPILDLALALGGRTYGEHERSVVKLSDTCTSLLPSILARSPGSRVLLLYHGLRRFLVALLRRPERRQYARNMRIRADIDLRAVGRGDLVTGDSLSDGRCAALIWLGLMYPYRRLLAAAPDRVRSLDAETLFQDPLEILARLDAFFALGIGADRLEGRLAEGALSRDAKDSGRSFQGDEYRAELLEAEARLQDEINDAVTWSRSVSAAEPLPSSLPGPL